jgi:hypothetical protein
MIRANSSPPARNSVILTDRRDLVEGINGVFLFERAVLPIGLNGEQLVCAVTCIDDVDTLAALAFASGRRVHALLATREAILAAMDAPLAKPASPPHIPAVRHAQAVVVLRQHIVQASSHGAEALRIVTDPDGGMVLAIRRDQSTELARLSHRETRALIGAADALAAAGQDGRPGFAVNIAGALYRAIIDQAPDGRIIQFGPGGIDSAP